MTKKNLTILLILVLIGFVAYSWQSHRKVEIRFSWWGGNSRHKATLEAIDRFEAKYPNIHVIAEYGEWTGYNEKLTTQINEGLAPDLMQVNWNILFEIGKDKFEDIEKTEIDLKNYNSKSIEDCTIDGKLVALPISIAGRVFYYQKDVYDKLGLAIPESFEDLFHAGKIFHEKLGPEHYPLVFQDFVSFFSVLYYLEQTTGKSFIKGKKVNYTEEELKIGLEFYLKLVEGKVIPPTFSVNKNRTVSVPENQFWTEGYFGGLFQWNTQANYVKEKFGEEVELVVGSAPLDYGKGALPAKVSMTMAINIESKHKKETELFLNYLLTDPDGVKAMGLERGVPLNKEAITILREADMLKGLQYDAYLEVMKNAGNGISPYFEKVELRELYREILKELDICQDSSASARRLIRGVEKILSEM